MSNGKTTKTNGQHKGQGRQGRQRPSQAVDMERPPLSVWRRAQEAFEAKFAGDTEVADIPPASYSLLRVRSLVAQMPAILRRVEYLAGAVHFDLKLTYPELEQMAREAGLPNGVGIGKRLNRMEHLSEETERARRRAVKERGIEPEEFNRHVYGDWVTLFFVLALGWDDLNIILPHSAVLAGEADEQRERELLRLWRTLPPDAQERQLYILRMESDYSVSEQRYAASGVASDTDSNISAFPEQQLTQEEQDAVRLIAEQSSREAVAQLDVAEAKFKENRAKQRQQRQRKGKTS